MTGPAAPLAQRHRFSLRGRLTLLYGAAFTAAAIVILASVYFVVDQSLEHAQRTVDSGLIITSEQPSSGQAVALTPQAPTSPPSDESAPPSAVNLVASALRTTKDTTMRDLLLAIAGILAGSLFAASLGGRWLARYALSPLRHVTSTAAGIAHDGHLKTRINLCGPRDEVTELADTFDHMLGRLDQSFESQRRFISSVSHELRTPLAIERALLQVTPDRQTPDDHADLRGRLLALNRRTSALVEDLLALATGEQPLSDRVAIDLAALATTVTEHARPEARARHSELELHLADAVVLGSEVLLERALANLVRNAIIHSPSGSTILVSTRTTTNPAGRRQAQIVVSNPGSEIDPVTLERILEPFQRAGTDSTGTGLGLPIARAIVTNHDGDLSLVARVGGGLLATVTLPSSLAIAEV